MAIIGQEADGGEVPPLAQVFSKGAFLRHVRKIATPKESGPSTWDEIAAGSALFLFRRGETQVNGKLDVRTVLLFEDGSNCFGCSP
jgi:hypothetical protein